MGQPKSLVPGTRLCCPAFVLDSPCANQPWASSSQLSPSTAVGAGFVLRIAQLVLPKAQPCVDELSISRGRGTAQVLASAHELGDLFLQVLQRRDVPVGNLGTNQGFGSSLAQASLHCGRSTGSSIVGRRARLLCVDVIDCVSQA